LVEELFGVVEQTKSGLNGWEDASRFLEVEPACGPCLRPDRRRSGQAVKRCFGIELPRGSGEAGFGGARRMKSARKCIRADDLGKRQRCLDPGSMSRERDAGRSASPAGAGRKAEGSKTGMRSKMRYRAACPSGTGGKRFAAGHRQKVVYRRMPARSGSPF